MNSNSIEWVYDEAIHLSEVAEIIRPDPQTIENMIMKAMEELGELSTDILKLKDYKVNDENKDEIRQNAKEEAIDGILIYLNICNKLGITKDEFVEIATRKLKKWNSKHLKNG